MNKKQEILDCALSRLRKYGYNGCSFREVASELGIKHTSIHYYFPTKDDLVEAVIANYSQDFFQQLWDLTLDWYFQVFIDVADKKESCLCSVLTHDKWLLSEIIVSKLEWFKQENISYLQETLVKSWKTTDESKLLSETIFASLEWALGFWNLTTSNMLKNVCAYWKDVL